MSTKLFTVYTNNNRTSHQLEDAVASYLFTFMSLNDRIPLTSQTIHWLTSKAEAAFHEVLGGREVILSTDNYNSIHVLIKECSSDL